MNTVVQKPWGTTKEHGSSPSFSVHGLWVHAGGYCSVHLHRRKANSFHVTSGILDVTVYGDDGTPEVIRLSGGDGDRKFLEVGAGVYHSFLAVSDAELLEIYRAVKGYEVEADDIERLSDSGRYEDFTPEVVERHHQSKILSFPPKDKR